MSKKKKSRRPKTAPSTVPAHPPSAESRPAVATTVAWMLALLVTLGAEAISAVAGIIARFSPAPPGPGLTMTHVCDLFLFVALVTGVICFGLMRLSNRIRRTPPPWEIVATSVVAGLVPIGTMLIRWLV